MVGLTDYRSTGPTVLLSNGDGTFLTAGVFRAPQTGLVLSADVAAMATTGEFSGLPPIEPKKGLLP